MKCLGFVFWSLSPSFPASFESSFHRVLFLTFLLRFHARKEEEEEEEAQFLLGIRTFDAHKREEDTHNNNAHSLVVFLTSPIID